MSRCRTAIGASLNYSNQQGQFSTEVATSSNSTVTNPKNPCNCTLNWSGHYIGQAGTGPQAASFFIYR